MYLLITVLGDSAEVKIDLGSRLSWLTQNCSEPKAIFLPAPVEEGGFPPAGNNRHHRRCPDFGQGSPFWCSLCLEYRSGIGEGHFVLTCLLQDYSCGGCSWLVYRGISVSSSIRLVASSCPLSLSFLKI